ncbi:pyruvate decarboxylase [Riemerella anatipestifer]|uniref:Pyruvate decarboxylase n=1 Tax=Riemerella anatipestifer TaxID=34085 RepID=A0AAP6HGT0_RIEAN|nr:pyruvate decarboxylase [Riemerella anatipestifer]MBT0548614.1 pyruvate decarboxylase [Riemerella anatipestifer]MBT0555498.1 pyruvate decarboxylase [Riemerella anatipestifer]MBT0559377.1 pyruvate decarboxylase [Riemerella anatipestifer]MCD5968419.1 pyruvate decarboxylase [Riemerella anatipestifer]MCO7355546.1 pyruvate decarboxylase [Riemerella anatipestifer]
MGMKKTLILIGISVSLICTIGCSAWGDSLSYLNKNIKIKKVKKVVYFNPVITPEIPEIYIPTYNAFYSAASDFLKDRNSGKILRVDCVMSYENIDTEYIKEICLNNNAEVVLIPRVKYFKVGFGRYVFSNQVLVSAKLYDADGNFIIETSYDTYKGNARLLGNAENSVKIGTIGMLRKMNKEIRRYKLNSESL